MAYFGLSKPVIAKYNAADGSYSEGMGIGKLCSTSVTPSLAEGSLYADNAESEHKKRFKNAAVAVEVDALPIEAAELLFGHTIDSSKKSDISKTSDSANYVGYGFVVMNTKGGTDSYTGVWLEKVLFTEGEESFTTSGDNITFSTPNLSGVAVGNEAGEWREKQTFDTEAEAYDFIKKKANITQTT